MKLHRNIYELSKSIIGYSASQFHISLRSILLSFIGRLLIIILNKYTVAAPANKNLYAVRLIRRQRKHH